MLTRYFFAVSVLCVFLTTGCTIDTVQSDETLAKDFIAINATLEAETDTATRTINGSNGGTYSSVYESPTTIGAKTVSTYTGYITPDGYTINGSITKETTDVLIDMQIYTLPSGNYSGQIILNKGKTTSVATVVGTWRVGGAVYDSYSTRKLTIGGIAYSF